jgi:hypothetical protein
MSHELGGCRCLCIQKKIASIVTASAILVSHHARQASQLFLNGASIANLVGSQSIILKRFPQKSLLDLCNTVKAALDDSPIASVDTEFVKRYGSCPRRLLRGLVSNVENHTTAQRSQALLRHF